jgi:D-alanine-D-alanine ligase
MTEKINLGIILGGRSGEHEVSLMSSRSVLSVLDREKFNVTEIGIDHNGLWWSGEHVLEALEKGSTQGLHRVFLLPEPGKTVLYKRSFENASEVITPIAELDVIFPVLHGTFGEDGTRQGFFEMADIAYVGAGVLGSSVGMDKSVFKDVMRANGIPVSEWITCTRREIETNVESVIKRAEAVADYPLFVKPANLGSSVGITKVKNHSDLYEGILEAARYDRRILIERGINAREIEVSVLGNEDAQASLPGEIVPSDEFYSYNAKYLDGKSNLFIPAPLSDELTEKIRELAVKTYKAIDCAGMARVDFLLDKDTNDLYINEVNTIPGFTSISMYPKLWDAGGLTYPALIEKLIDLALERKQERNKSKRTFGD